MTDDFRLHDVGDAVNLGGGVQESDGVSIVLPLYLHDGVQVDDLLTVLLLVLQLVVHDVGGIFLTVLPLCRFEEVRESLSLVIIVLIFFPFLAIILLFAFFIVILLVILQDGGCSNNLELIEDHTNSLVSVEAARVVLHQFAAVKPYF